MEMLVKIMEVGDMTNRTYTDRNGQSQTIICRQIMLKSGEDTFHAEATGDKAVQITNEYKGATAWARIGMTARKGQKADGTEFTATNINVYSLEKI